MAAQRKDAFADACIRLYVAGHSLAEIAAMVGVTRQSVHRMLARRDVAMRQASPRPFVWWNGAKYTLRNNGYYGKSTGDRQRLHRAMWEDAYGPIPEGYDVHHLDEDKSNNSLENFVLHTKQEHGRRHGFGGNQYTGSLGSRPVKW